MTMDAPWRLFWEVTGFWPLMILGQRNDIGLPDPVVSQSISGKPSDRTKEWMDLTHQMHFKAKFTTSPVRIHTIVLLVCVV